MGAMTSKLDTTLGARIEGAQGPRDVLLDKTNRTRYIIDKILEFMLKEVNVSDLYVLSNPDECKKYVLLFANSLDNMFYKLQLEPSVDKTGSIFFRSVKELTQPTSERDRLIRQKMCLTLSYFYARVFQIFGALALTIMDDAELFRATKMADYFTKGSEYAPVEAPGFQKYITRGGAVEDYIYGNFIFLKDHLEIISLEDRKFRFKNNIDILLIINKISDYDTTAQILFRNKTGVKQSSRINVRARGGEGINKIVMDIGDVEYYVSGIGRYVKVNRQLVYYGHKTDAFIKDIEGDGKYAYMPPNFKYKDKDFIPQNKILSVPFDILVKEAREYYNTHKEQIERGRTYDIERDERDRYGYGERDRDRYGDRDKYRDGDRYRTLNGYYVFSRRADEGAEQHLRIRELAETLQKKPVAHCVARALQLLKSPPPFEKEGYKIDTDICKDDFLKNSKGTIRSTLPVRNKPLTSSMGLQTVSQLFYDVMGDGKLVRSNESMKEYVAFLNRLSQDYGIGAAMDENKKMKDITYTRDNPMCTSGKSSPVITDANAKRIYGIVMDLFDIQLRHTANVGVLLSELFELKQSPDTTSIQISFNPEIKKLGLRHIQSINSKARNLLMIYYTNCELKYREALGVISASMPSQPVATAPRGKDGEKRRQEVLELQRRALNSNTDPTTTFSRV